MDDFEKKLFTQLDDPMPGQRSNAVEMLHGRGVKFCDYVQQIERGEQYDALEQETVALRQEKTALGVAVTQYKAAVGKWQKAYAAQGVALAIMKGLAWGR